MIIDKYETIDVIIKVWRSFAAISNIQDKRSARLKLLSELQQKLLNGSNNIDYVKRLIIALCKQVHGSDYDYNDIRVSETTKITDKIGVICPIHGLFFVRILDHLIPTENGKCAMGCIRCLTSLNKEQRLNRPLKKVTTAAFITKAELIHGDKYDYQFSKYIASRADVIIGCISCKANDRDSIFQQRVHTHLEGKGCMRCGNQNKCKNQLVSFDDVVAKARLKHGNNYTYVDILPPEKKGDKRRIKYHCNVCGSDVVQKLAAHLFGIGCRVCGNRKRGDSHLMSFDEAISRSVKVQRTRYQYVKLIPPKEKEGQNIIYICPDCLRLITQPLHDHLKGHGCSVCHLIGGDYSKIEHMMRFYFVKICQYDRYGKIIDEACKIGCTQDTINRRFSGSLPPNMNIEILYEHEFIPGKLAFEVEQFVRKQFIQYRYCGDIYILNGGNNELFLPEVEIDMLKQIRKYARFIEQPDE